MARLSVPALYALRSHAHQHHRSNTKQNNSTRVFCFEYCSTLYVPNAYPTALRTVHPAESPVNVTFVHTCRTGSDRAQLPRHRRVAHILKRLGSNVAKFHSYFVTWHFTFIPCRKARRDGRAAARPPRPTRLSPSNPCAVDFSGPKILMACSGVARGLHHRYV